MAKFGIENDKTIRAIYEAHSSEVAIKAEELLDTHDTSHAIDLLEGIQVSLDYLFKVVAEMQRREN